jgi:hypothetical protein
VRIDLNADVGESFGAWSIGEDEALAPFVTSFNIAAGMHAEPGRARADGRLGCATDPIGLTRLRTSPASGAGTSA